MPTPLTALLATKIAEAEAGVDFSRRHGARCPSCGQTAKITCTKRWEGDTRIRYHRCQNPACILASSKTAIKSVEVDEIP